MPGSSRPGGSLARKLGPRLVVIASPSIVDQYRAAGGAGSLLANQMGQLTLDADVEGAMSLDPIRDFIAQLTSLGSALGSGEMDAWKRLPESLQSTSLQISLDGPESVVVRMQVDDPELADAIVEIGQSNGNGSSASPWGGGRSPLGGFGGLSMLGGGGAMSADAMGGRKPLREPTVAPWLTKIGKQISEDDLFLTDRADSEIVFRLKRPDGLSELLAAAIVDANHQYRLSLRSRAARQLATAMKDYEAEHGCLPPSGVIVGHADGIPDQFNWRTGLLKYLDPERYAQFRFEEAWDSPHNLKIAEEIPEAFTPIGLGEGTDSGGQSLAMQLNAVRGGLYRGDAAPRLETIKDTRKYTALLIEAPVVGPSTWTQPGAGVLSDAGADLGDPAESGVLYVDAGFDLKAVRRGDQLPSAVLSIAGDESVSRNDMLIIPASNEN